MSVADGDVLLLCTGGGTLVEVLEVGLRGTMGSGGYAVLCIRVLTISSGWTVSVAIEPAARPAMVSTRAGEMPACLTSVMEDVYPTLHPEEYGERERK